MIQIIQAQNLHLIDLQQKFGLQLAEEDQFFTEWLDDLPEITEFEKQVLDRAKVNYHSLVQRREISENMVKMVLVSYLLDLADFYRLPFDIKDEKSLDISVEDQEQIVRGRLDIMVLKYDFWLLIIESKNAGLSLLNGIPQALAYMLANPQSEKPVFGLVTNGEDFVFIKLTKQNTPRYALSDQFTLLKRENELYRVLSVMKKLGQLLRQ